jgi:hypothetical protein
MKKYLIIIFYLLYLLLNNVYLNANEFKENNQEKEKIELIKKKIQKINPIFNNLFKFKYVEVQDISNNLLNKYNNRFVLYFEYIPQDDKKTILFKDMFEINEIGRIKKNSSLDEYIKTVLFYVLFLEEEKNNTKIDFKKMEHLKESLLYSSFSFQLLDNKEKVNKTIYTSKDILLEEYDFLRNQEIYIDNNDIYSCYYNIDGFLELKIFFFSDIESVIREDNVINIFKNGCCLNNKEDYLSNDLLNKIKEYKKELDKNAKKELFTDKEIKENNKDIYINYLNNLSFFNLEYIKKNEKMKKNNIYENEGDNYRFLKWFFKVF